MFCSVSRSAELKLTSCRKYIYLHVLLFVTESSERSWKNRVGVEKFGESELQIERDRNFVEQYQIL